MRKVGRFPGVYQYEAKRRRYDGRPDVCYYIMYKDQSGKLRREKIGWRSEGITAVYASQIRAERLRAIRLGEEISPPKKALTFDQLAQEYLEWARHNKKSWNKDEQRYRVHLADPLGNLKLKEITPFLLEKLKNDLFEKGLAPATVKHCLVLVRQIINKGKAWGLYKGDNPVTKIKLPTLNNERIRFLSYEEADALLKEVRKRSQQAYEMCLLSLYTGMRIGEITALKWSDIDFDSKTIVIKDPKNRETKRVFMGETVESMFRAKSRGEPEELVFKTRDGKPLNNNAPKGFISAVKALGLNDGVKDPRDRISFHSLRHTFASWLAIEGVPLLTIKELLGHKTLAMVQRYAHLSPGHKREAVRKIQNRLAKAGERKVVPFSLEGEASSV